MNWTEYYIEMASVVAKKSKDPNARVGCLIVGPDKEIRTTGYNGFPRGVVDKPYRLSSKSCKLGYMVHSEANAVASAARTGTPIKGCMAVVTKHPCSQCAALMIQAGIVKVLTPRIDDSSSWAHSNLTAQNMLEEAGVEIEYY